MIKNTVLQHKIEKDKLLAKNYILRQNLGSAQKFLDSDLIKVITGPRRSGKSVFSLLLLREKDFVYLNFDDENILKVKNYDEILEAVFEVYPERRYFLFDEIQNLPNWELFVNKLQRRGYNLILTGSNARLLSKELATSLTGRYVATEIFPFSFKEFLTAKNFSFKKEDLALPETRGRIINFLDEYLQSGGFPEVVVKNLDPKTYLETLIDAILLRDVVRRHKVRFSRELYNLALYLFSNFSCEFSFNKLRNILQFQSTSTLQKYLGYLEEAYLFFTLNRFSFKVKEQIKSPKKIYGMDNGLIRAKDFALSHNTGRHMENLVLVENLRRGCKANEDIFYYRAANHREVDFVLKQGIGIRQLIQVCYDLNNIDTRTREIKSLFEAGRELNCKNLLVINWDYEGEEEIKGRVVKFIPLWKWLLENG